MPPAKTPAGIARGEHPVDQPREVGRVVRVEPTRHARGTRAASDTAGTERKTNSGSVDAPPG